MPSKRFWQMRQRRATTCRRNCRRRRTRATSGRTDRRAPRRRRCSTLYGDRAALHAAEMEVGLVIEAPQLVGDQLAVAVGIERRVGVDMDHRRHPAVIGLLHIRIDAERAFLRGTSSSTSRTSSCTLPSRPLIVMRLRQLEHVPDRVDPGADADDDIVAGDRPRLVLSAVTAPEFEPNSKPVHLDAGQDAHALGLGLGRRGRTSRRCCWRSRRASRAAPR